MQKKRNIIPLVETYNEVDTEKYIKSYISLSKSIEVTRSECPRFSTSLSTPEGNPCKIETQFHVRVS